MSDTEKFVPTGEEYTLSNGGKITIMPLPWGKEIQVCQMVSKFFSDNNIIDIFNKISETEDGEDSGLETTSMLLTPLIQEAPQIVTKIVAILINKEEVYVEETLTSDDVMGVFIPFLKSLFNKYTKMFQQVSQPLVT